MEEQEEGVSREYHVIYKEKQVPSGIKSRELQIRNPVGRHLFRYLPRQFREPASKMLREMFTDCRESICTYLLKPTSPFELTFSFSTTTLMTKRNMEVTDCK